MFCLVAQLILGRNADSSDRKQGLQRPTEAVPKPALLPRGPKSPRYLPAIAINTSGYLNTTKVSPCEGSAHSPAI